MTIDDLVKMCHQLITGFEQHKFTSEQEIMSAYSIKERFLTGKLKLMKQTTHREMFTKVRPE